MKHHTANLALRASHIADHEERIAPLPFCDHDPCYWPDRWLDVYHMALAELAFDTSSELIGRPEMRKEPAKNGNEMDWTSGWRWVLKVYDNWTGLGKQVKRAMNKRARRRAKMDVRKQVEE